MSCIVGLKYNRKVYIGGDGRATSSEGEIRPVICNKVFKNKKYLMGFCGSVRAGQLLYPECFTPPDTILKFPNAMRKHYEENGVLLHDTETGDIHGANILIGIGGRLYEILIDFQMSEIEEFTSVGSGANFAFGALEILKRTKLSPEDKILTALKVSAKYCAQVGPPYEVRTC